MDINSPLPDGMSCSSGRNFFESVEWFKLISTFGFIERPNVRVLTSDPVEQEPTYAFFLREERRTRRLVSLANYYSAYFPGVVSTESGPMHDSLDRLVGLLAAERPNCLEIRLQYLLADSPHLPVLCSALREAGFRVFVSHQDWNWYSTVESSDYDRYLSQRPSRLRNTLRRRARSVGTRDCSVVHFQGSEGLSEALADFQTVYSRSWKKPENTPEFMPRLMRLCADLDVLRLGILYLDQRPVAAQFWICSAGVSYVYKLAHDKRFDDLSVGSLLTADMFRWAIDTDGAREINFGVGNERYKSDWMNGRRQILTVQAINPATAPGLLLLARKGLKSVLERTRLLSGRSIQSIRRYPRVHQYGTIEC